MLKNPLANVGDVRDAGLILGSGRSPGGRHGNPSQYSCLENPRDRGAWQAAVLGVTQSQTQLKRLSGSTTSILEKEVATHSRILAWKIPRAEEPGGLQSFESQRVRHNQID